MNSAKKDELFEHLDEEEKKEFCKILEERDFVKSFHKIISHGNIKLFELFITHTRLEENKSDLENILEQAYCILKVSNVPLSGEMEFVVETKLIDLRFFVDKTIEKEKKSKISLNDVKCRIELLNNLSCNMIKKYSSSHSSDIDGEFLLLGRFIAQNIHILKRQLKKTFTKLPWEEMEFVLVCFMESFQNPNSSNIIYQLILHREQLLNHLQNFITRMSELEKELTVKDVNSNCRLGSRNEIILSVLAESPEFQHLYQDHDLMRSIYSLKRIGSYIQDALAIDLTEGVTEVNSLVLERTLQVIGESLKSTPESPNISEQVYNLLSRHAPRHTRELSVGLRDCLSHSYSFTHRPEQDNMFCRKILTDLKKVNAEITFVLYKMKEEALKIFLNKIIASQTLAELKRLVQDFDFIQTIEFPLEGNLTEEFWIIKQLFEDLKEKLKNKSGIQTLLSEAQEILDSNENRLVDVEENFANEIPKVKNVITLIASETSSVKNICASAKSCLEILSDETAQQCNLKSIINIISEIFCKVLTNYDPDLLENDAGIRTECREIQDIVLEIFRAIEFLAGRISDVHQFKNKIGKNLEDDKKTYDKVNVTLNVIFENIDSPDDKYSVESEISILKRLHNDKKKIIKLLEDKSNGENSDEKEYCDIVGKMNLNTRNVKNLHKFYADSDITKCNELVQKIDHYGQFAKTLEDLSLFSQDKYGKALKTFFEILKLKAKTKEKLFLVLEKHLVHKKLEAIAYFKSRLQLLNKILSSALAEKSVFHKLSIEMLVLELTEILENMSFFGDNKLFMDQSCPLLIGKNLRNYLAHGNVLVDSFPHKPLTSITYSAKLLVKAGENFITNQDILIGQNIESDLYKLKNMHNWSLTTVVRQDKFYAALKQNNINQVKDCIEKGADFKGSDVTGWTGLHFAAANGNITLLKYFLDCGLNLEHKDNYGQNPLHIAYTHSKIDLIQYLIKEKYININNVNFHGRTLFHLASSLGRLDIIAELLRTSQSIDHGDVDNQTALHVSCLSGQADVVKFLLENGASVHARTLTDEVPLHFAAQSGNVPMLEILFKAGASLWDADENGWTALHHAAYKGHAVVIKHLLENITDVKRRLSFMCAPTKQLKRALHLAAIGEHKDAVKELLTFNCPISMKDCFHLTAVQYAWATENKDLIQILDSRKANLLDENGINWESMDLATKNGQKEETEENALGECSLLHTAAANGHIGVLQLLFQNNVSIDIRSDNGFTALHFAVKYQHVDATKLLICHAKKIGKCEEFINSTNEDNSTALHVGVAIGNKECVQELLNGGAFVEAKDIKGCTALHLAAKYGVTSVAKMLIDKGCNLKSVTHDGWSALHFAVDYGHEDTAALLVKNGIPLNIYTNSGETVLHCAAAKDYRKIAEIILDRVPKADLQDFVNKARTIPLSRTALHFTARNGFREFTSLLLKHDSDLEALDESDNSPLIFAVVGGYSDITSLLIAKGASIHTKANPSGVLLCLAAKYGHFDILKQLLSTGADIYSQGDKAGSTALHSAVEYNKPLIVEYLLQEKIIDMDVVDNTGKSPLHLAILLSFFDMVQLLIEHGASVDITDKNNLTPLHYAAQTGNLCIFRYLLENGSKIEEKTNRGLTSLHIAANFGNIDIVEEILNCNVDPDSVEEPNDSTALITATYQEQTEVIQLLLSRGANPEASVTINKIKPIHIAAANGFLATVNIFLDAGVDVNTRANNGWTTLHFAANTGQLEVVKLLVNHKARLTEECDEGVTALDYAEHRGHQHVSKYLEQLMKTEGEKN